MRPLLGIYDDLVDEDAGRQVEWSRRLAPVFRLLESKSRVR